MLWGDYTEPVPLIQEVHNLEHGGMIIQYGNKVPQADITKINAFWQKDPTAMLVAPLPNLGNKIAMTAWTQWAECTSFNQKAFKAFQSAFRYHAPESPSSRRARSSRACSWRKPRVFPNLPSGSPLAFATRAMVSAPMPPEPGLAGREATGQWTRRAKGKGGPRRETVGFPP